MKDRWFSETGAAPRIDRLARLAASLLEATTVVLFVRGSAGVRVVSAHGLDTGMEKVIPGDQVLDAAVLVPDLAKDSSPVASAWTRVSVTARACALVPVRHVGSAIAGALAVLTAQPRSWSTIELALLEELAAVGGEVLAALEAVPERSSSKTARRTPVAHKRRARWAPAGARRSAGSARRPMHSRGLVDGLVVVFDHDLRITLAAGARFENAGDTSVERQLLLEACPPEVAPMLAADATAALAGTSTVREIRDGNRVWRTHTHPVRPKASEVAGGMVIVRNVTRRALAERDLRESEARYRLLFEDATQPMIVYRVEGDAKGAIIAANAAAGALVGYGPDELHRMTLSELTAPEARAEAQARIAKILGQGREEGESVLLKKDGTRVLVEFRSSLVHLGGERVALSVGHDITARREMEAALRAAKEAAEAANRAKSAFLANMSHEIRTPMNAILGYAQLLRRAPGLTRSHQEGVEIINRSGEHLLALINDVLDLSKIEAGHLQISREEVNLAAMIDDLAAMFRLRAEAKLLGFEVMRSPAVPQHVLTDATKLRQMLVNLLDNAIKFTASGGVVARFVMRAARPGATTLVVEVEDSGPGIAPDDLKLLFRPFGQTRAGIHARGGTGLGLVLSREFARCMGGDVTVESRVGVGSAFRLELPVEPARQSMVAPSRPSCRVVGVAGEAPPIRVLVVDDDEDNRGWISQLLSAVGFEVHQSADGNEALAVFDALRPRLVLLDMNMPVLDGCAFLRGCRARAGGRDTVIIALTASMLENEREAVRAAGADGWLLKPCREEVLFAEVGRLLGVEYRYAAAPPRESSRPLTPLEVSAVRRGLGRTLPPALVEGLREAARTADYSRLLELLEEIPDELGAIAQGLRELVECYAYDVIDAALAE